MQKFFTMTKGEDASLESMETYETVSQPEALLVHLFPHQLAAIAMMEKRERMRQACQAHFLLEFNTSIYSDLTGYGKTYAMIGLIVRDRMSWDMNHEYIHENISSVFGHGSIIKKSIIRLKRFPTTLVVTGPSLIRQWTTSLMNSPSLKTIVISSMKKVMLLEPSEYDVVLCTAKLYNSVLEKFPNYAWKRFIFDEPTHVKIQAMRPMYAGFLWFVTATPNLLLYTPRKSNSFLHTLFSSYMDYPLFKSLIVKNEDQFVKASFDMPIEHYYHECHQPIYRVLKDLISEPVLEMIAAGNIEKAIKSLGGSTSSNIFHLIESEKQELLREAEWKMEKYKRLEQDELCKKWSTKYQVLQNEVKTLHARLQKEMVEGQCHICLQQNVQPVLLTCCQNMFCGACVLRWLQEKTECPLCRTAITPRHMLYIESTPMTPSLSIVRPVKTTKTKLEMIVDIIQQYSDGRFIIFSCYDETCHLIRNTLRYHQIPFGEVSGTLRKRENCIQNFKENTCSVLFLNSIHNGAGLDLQEATDIILYHPMMECLETQIIGRAQRIGRTSILRVHHFV